MSRDVNLYLAEIELVCKRAIRYASGFTCKEFIQDDEKYDAVLLNLEIIGEAVKHGSDDLRDKYLQIKWRKIAGFRDIVAHEYFGISDKLIWDIVHNGTPPLHKSVKFLVKICNAD